MVELKMLEGPDVEVVNPLSVWEISSHGPGQVPLHPPSGSGSFIQCSAWSLGRSGVLLADLPELLVTASKA